MHRSFISALQYGIEKSNVILHLNHWFLLPESFMKFCFVCSVLKFNNDVHGLGPFLSILLIFGDPFKVATHVVLYSGNFICSITWIIFSYFLFFFSYLKLLLFDFGSLGLIIYLNVFFAPCAFICLFFFLGFLNSSSFNSSIETFLFFCHTFLVVKIPFCFLNVSL